MGLWQSLHYHCWPVALIRSTINPLSRLSYHPMISISHSPSATRALTVCRVKAWKAVGLRWNPWTCAQGLHRTVDQCLHRHFKPVPTRHNTATIVPVPTQYNDHWDKNPISKYFQISVTCQLLNQKPVTVTIWFRLRGKEMLCYGYYSGKSDGECIEIIK